MGSERTSRFGAFWSRRDRRQTLRFTLARRLPIPGPRRISDMACIRARGDFTGARFGSNGLKAMTKARHGFREHPIIPPRSCQPPRGARDLVRASLDDRARRLSTSGVQPPIFRSRQWRTSSKL